MMSHKKQLYKLRIHNFFTLLRIKIVDYFALNQCLCRWIYNYWRTKYEHEAYGPHRRGPWATSLNGNWTIIANCLFAYIAYWYDILIVLSAIWFKKISTSIYLFLNLYSFYFILFSVEGVVYFNPLNIICTNNFGKHLRTTIDLFLL